MASIDKLYGNRQQYNEFHSWLTEHNPQLLTKLFDPNMFDDQNKLIIAMFDESEDEWLYVNCGIQFVIDRLNEQYSYKTRINWLMQGLPK